MGHVRGWFLGLGLAVLGCNYDASSQGGATGTSGGSSSGGPGESTQDGVPGSSTGGVDGSSSGSSGGSGSTGGSSSSSGDVTTGEPLPTARSCAEVLEEDPRAQTGVHTIASTSDGSPVDVWCEMEVDGGGWTLVARSANGGQGPFGWGVARGELEAITEPYSLDVASLGMPFTEILIGSRSGWAGVGENAYVIEVPEGFLEDYEDSTYMAGPARTVAGDCDPPGGPDMLERVGHTANDETYFFRDIVDFDVHGLQPDELETYFDDCNRGGDMDDAQGALFVR